MRFWNDVFYIWFAGYAIFRFAFIPTYGFADSIPASLLWPIVVASWIVNRK